jgi:glutamate-ammonia-ligase adenylyltransferase
VLKSAVIEMREKMFDAHPNVSGLFDLKHGRGGIIDVEFVVQYLVLGYAHAYSELTGNIGNLALLKLAAKVGLIPEAAALGAHDAYRKFRQLQHSLRLQGEKYARTPVHTVAAEVEAVRSLWRVVMGEEKGVRR